MDISTSSLLQPVDDGLPMRDSGEWAKDKCDILARYIDTSTYAIKDKPWRRRFYIDLQAGPGKNRCPNGEVFLGSPLLALTKGAGFTDYRFVEKDEAFANALLKRCEASAQQQSVQIIVGDCNEVANQIANEVEQIDQPPFSKTDWNSLCLVFLDPEGLELEWRTVARIASLRRADLIINFSTGGLRRSAPGAIALPPDETAVDRFFGTLDWRSIPRNSDGSMPAHEWIEFYRERLTGLGYRWGTSIRVKNSKNVELYRLLFASKHDLGIKLWEDARKNAPTQRALF